MIYFFLIHTILSFLLTKKDEKKMSSKYLNHTFILNQISSEPFDEILMNNLFYYLSCLYTCTLCKQCILTTYPISMDNNEFLQFFIYI